MLLEQILNGLVLGSIWALLAMGFTMVYGVIRLMNFAHGGIFVLSAYYVIVLIRSVSLPLPLTLLIAAIGTCLTALTIAFFGYRPLFHKSKLSLLLIACGMYQLIENLTIVLFGARTQSFPIEFPRWSLALGGVSIQGIHVFILLFAGFLMLVTHLFIMRTKPGSGIRAVAQDIDCAYLMGINVERMIYLTFIIGALLAIAGAVLIGMYYSVMYPTIGFMAMLVAFAACVVGGMGSIPGAMLGGIVMGLAQSLAAGYIGSGWRDAIAFAVLIIVLLLKPEGLFFQPETVEKV